MKKNVFRKGLVIGIIILFVGAGIIPQAGAGSIAASNMGQIIYVDDDSPCPGDGSFACPYHNISSALENASNLDIILVANGTYYENINISNDGLTLESYYRYNIDYRGEDEGDIYGNDTDAVIDGGGVCNIIWIDNKESINIIGFTINNSGPYGAGIYVHISPGVKIRCNIIENCYCGILCSYTEKIDDVPEIQKNIIRNNSYGVYLEGTVDLEITENLFENNRVINIALVVSVGTDINSNEIINSRYCIFLEESNNNDITFNNIINKEFGIYGHYASRNSRNWWYHNYWNPNPYAFFDRYIIWGLRILRLIDLKLPIMIQIDWKPSETRYDIPYEC